MKRTLIAAAGFALFATSGLASAASWSVIVEPGVYGRVAIGGYADVPQVYTPQPVVAVDNGYGQVVEEFVDPAYATEQTPVYLWVPEYQRLHWAQYCREYGAYGVPVYFVDDGWYRANVMRRQWTPEQRSWSQQQWQEQDRVARDRFERQRFEQQRYEQQQRWNQQRDWQGQRQPQQRAGDDQNRRGWGSAHADVPLPQQNNPAPRPQAGGQWQQAGGPWPQQRGQWQQPVGQAQQPGNGGGYPHQSGGRPAGYPPANGGNGAGVGPQQPQQSQPPAASQPRGVGRGAPIQAVGDRQGDESRGQDRGERRGQGDSRGAFEHGRDARRDR